MAENPGLNRYNQYYSSVLAQLQQDAGPQMTDSQLKNNLQRVIRPTYDQAIRQRQQQTGQANAAIDMDAASRGMGTSTWVTDAKNRQRQAEAADIAGLNSNYGSALYEALLAQMNQRDQNRLNLMGQAQSIAGNMYDRWKAETPASASSGGMSGIDSKAYYDSLKPHSSPHRNPGTGTGGGNEPTSAEYTAPKTSSPINTGAVSAMMNAVANQARSALKPQSNKDTNVYKRK